MENTPCTIKHITLVEIANGVRYTGKIDWEGMGVNLGQGEVDFGEPVRYYFCSNCLKSFDGNETFDICKAHFGTFPLDE
jgi:hypothetical protein